MGARAAAADRPGSFQEVILALSPTAEGESTIHYLSEQLSGRVERISVPARGLPLGAEIEFTDAGILGEALRHRRSAVKEKAEGRGPGA